MEDMVPVAAAQAVPLVEVQVKGDLDAKSAPEVNRLLEQALALRPQQIVVDLADCDTIDGAGVLLLLDAHRRAVREGGAVALRSPSERARRALRLAKVDRIMQLLPYAVVELAPAGPVVA